MAPRARRMLAIAHSIALVGLEPHPIRVEVQSGRGTMSFDIVGLPETTVRESRVRVRTALSQLGIHLSSAVVTVNLAPADLRKTGSGYDLAIAIGTLAALGHVDISSLDAVTFLGELSLTGALAPIRGVLPSLMGARARGTRCAVVPRANGAEAATVARAEGLTVLVADDLATVLAWLRAETGLDAAEPTSAAPPQLSRDDLADVRGQPAARRALEVAAAGGHDLLMIGPPGVGKTMLARRLPCIMPPLEEDEALQVTALHSVASLLPPGAGLLRHRPFRAPHHTVSDAGLLGGGNPPRPGEISLAHAGVLFLDELPEFRRGALEGLRQPLEDGVITISRARGRTSFPARPMVVAAMNPCPCGFRSPDRPCQCDDARLARYRGRISGPILDRLDIHLALPPVGIDAITARTRSCEETTSTVRSRVERARAIQRARRDARSVTALTNARLNAAEARALVVLDDRAAALLRSAMERLALTARAHDKVLRVARTLADLDGRDTVHAGDVGEAIHYRLLDRRLTAAA